MNVLALSSSRVGNSGYLEMARPMIAEFLGEGPRNIAFVPFAAVDGDYGGYLQKVEESLQGEAYTINLVTPGEGRSVIEKADAVMIGGGNTFKLLHDLYQYNLVPLISDKVRSGASYIGWSAGANLTGPTICTTNDMPIIQPRSFESFGFFSFQLNPHYFNYQPEGFHGETRDQRLTEYILLNRGRKVVGIPEGTAVLRKGSSTRFIGAGEAALFEYQGGVRKNVIAAGADLSRF